MTTLAGLRALAHPTRLALLDLLRVQGTLTASQCATLLSLTPKVCSYHLHILAAQGLVEPAIMEGTSLRERPWQRATWETDVPLEDTPTDDPELEEAQGQFMRVRLQRDQDLLQDYVTLHDESHAGWNSSVTMYSRTALMSPAELCAWGLEVEAITREHVRRAELASSDAQEPVRLILNGFPQIMPRGRRS
ncbi:winged helix-turn-helix domain-containing protein [Phytomonospora endophytica]|uniref:DNA-binding transcriptional ArsR family regulator n=1 Tax=Phytomonospora endophytica TaxID=714109 RepID=A0A841FV90_9ACTN|nr:helix-turn-helix domain-containing protein [Phytomonospora endophytica]MBB6038683.1 DNA-binding transcriptional ArsR family regulator [Phytomonospora endophytica]GIG69172.1 transcriptional regulator [Phytomonospora endophytica]